MNIFSAVSPSLASSLLLVIGTLGAAITVLVVVIFFSTMLLRRILISWQEALGDERDVHKNAEAVLDHAREEALQITGQAQTKMKEFEEVLEHLGMSLEHQFKEIFEHRVKSEEQRLSEAYQQEIQRIMQDVAKTAEGASTEFLSSMQQQSLAHQSKMEAEFQALQKQGREAVETSKKEIIKQVEDSLYPFLAFISTRVLGGALNLESHQALVMRVLEDAKREGFFDL